MKNACDLLDQKHLFSEDEQLALRQYEGAQNCRRTATQTDLPLITKAPFC